MQVAVTVRSGDGWRAKGTHTHNVLRIGLPVCLCRSGTCDQGSFPLGRIHRVRRASAACRTFGCTVWCGHGQPVDEQIKPGAGTEGEREAALGKWRGVGGQTRTSGRTNLDGPGRIFCRICTVRIETTAEQGTQKSLPEFVSRAAERGRVTHEIKYRDRILVRAWVNGLDGASRG